jgi:hypothetical protein
LRLKGVPFLDVPLLSDDSATMVLIRSPGGSKMPVRPLRGGSMLVVTTLVTSPKFAVFYTISFTIYLSVLR